MITLRRFLFCLLGIVFLSSPFYNIYSQCSSVPVVQAITNGNFDDGYVGFKIGGPNDKYTILDSSNNSGSNPSNYQVGDNSMLKNGRPNSSTFNDAFTGIFDHTRPGIKGNMLMIDQSIPRGVSWQAEVNIIPNQIYYFSAWVVELDPPRSNAQLQFEIVDESGKETLLGTPFEANNTWRQTFVTWNSGNNKKATLRIKDYQEITKTGNDFALDDISFINGCNDIVAEKPDLGSTQTLCTEGSITLDAKTTGTTYNWSMVPTGSTKGVDLPDKSQKITATQPGTYQVCITSSKVPNCPITSSVEVSGTITPNLDPYFLLCKPPTATLDPRVKGSKLSYKWQKAELKTPNNFTDIAGATSATYNTANPGIFKVTVSSSVPGCLPKDDTTKVESKTATPKPGEFCKKDVKFEVENAGGGYKWYKTETGNQYLGSGASVTIPLSDLGVGPNDETVTVYVEDTTMAPYSGGPATTSSTGGYFSSGQNDRPLRFNAQKDFVLDTVKMVVKFYSKQSPDQRSNILLYDKSGKQIASRMVTVQNPKRDGNVEVTVSVNLNFKISQGDGYYLVLSDRQEGSYDKINAGVNSNATFPYKISTFATIVEPRQYDKAYYFFYNWRISVPPGCGRVPVTNKKMCPPCEPPTKLTITASAETEQCAPVSTANVILTAVPTPATAPAPDTYIYEWYKDGVKLNENTPTLNVPFPTPFGVAKYTLHVGHKDISNEQCYTVADTTVRVSEQLKPGSLKAEFQICENDSLKNVSLAPATGGGPGRSYHWESSPDPAAATWNKLANSNTADTLFVGITATTYFRRIVTDTKCPPDTTNTLKVDVLKIKNPKVTLAEVPPLCEMDPYTFIADTTEAGNAGTFYWTYNGVSVPNQSTGKMTINSRGWGSDSVGVVQVIIEPGKNGYRCYGQNGQAEIPIKIIKAQEPVVKLDSVPSICENTPVTFTAHPSPRSISGDKITYLIDGVIVQQDSVKTTYTSNTLKNGQKVTVQFTSGSTCATRPKADDVSITMKVYEMPKPVLSPNQDDTLCAGETKPTIFVNGGFTTSNLDTTFTWYINGKIVNGATRSFTNAAENGTYFAVIKNGACKDTSQPVRFLFEEPQVTLGPPINIFAGDSAHLNAVINGNIYSKDTVYSWSSDPEFTDSSFYINSSDTLHPWAKPKKSTIYKINVTTSNNCPAHNEVLVTVYQHIRVPNAFSPNGDGLNETWTIDGLYSYPNAEVRVFNRWGNVVFRSHGYQKAQEWDGMENGQPVPTATYYYVVDPKVDFAGGVRTGWVVVVK